MPIYLKSVSKNYINGDIITQAVKNVDLTINDAEVLVILGPSGSGKSTLLNIISGLDVPSTGVIKVNEDIISEMNVKELTLFRRVNLGFVFQQYNLLHTLTVSENVAIGAILNESAFDVNDVLRQVGLISHQKKYPYQLSGGEQQRVSIARAIAKNPSILFCDEPTGSLDETTGKEVLKVLIDLNKKYKTTMVIITHNSNIAQIADRIVRMNSGEIASVELNKEKKQVDDIGW